MLVLCTALLVTIAALAVVQRGGQKQPEVANDLTVVAAPTRGECAVQPGTLQEGVRHVTVRAESNGTVRIYAESGELVCSSTSGRTTSSRQQPRQAMARFAAGRYTVDCRTGHARLTSPLAVMSDG